MSLFFSFFLGSFTIAFCGHVPILYNFITLIVSDIWYFFLGGLRGFLSFTEIFLRSFLRSFAKKTDFWRLVLHKNIMCLRVRAVKRSSRDRFHKKTSRNAEVKKYFEASQVCPKNIFDTLK